MVETSDIYNGEVEGILQDRVHWGGRNQQSVDGGGAVDASVCAGRAYVTGGADARSGAHEGEKGRILAKGESQSEKN